MIRRLLQQLSGAGAGRRPARGRAPRGRRGRASQGTGARIGTAVERYLRSRR